MKVALLGGSFDPVHDGHIQMAQEALRYLGVDEVWFLPTRQTPLKDRKLSDKQDRLHMLRLALQDIPQCKVNTLEWDRKGKSYTVDTLETLHAQYPGFTFYWLMGNDQLEQFDQWKDPKRLVELAHFICFDRDGRMAKTHYKIQCMHMPPMPVSSSDIRKGNKLNYLHPDVLSYIYDRRLYVENFVKERVTPNRYEHSLSVAHLCEEIARAHGLDENKAYYIGLFHDIAKSMPKDRMEAWMDILCPENKKYAVPVWHGFVGSEVVDCIFGLRDIQLKNAIYHHVLGTSEDPYAMMIFCADKLDPLRGYPVQEQIKAVKKDLKQGFHRVQEENRKYLNGKDK